MWMNPLIDYIANGILADDRNESKKIKIKATRFTIIKGQLFKRSFSGPYLTCIIGEKIMNVLVELHNGEYINYLGARSLAHKALTVRYYLPTMRANSMSYVWKCDKC